MLSTSPVHPGVPTEGGCFSQQYLSPYAPRALIPTTNGLVGTQAYFGQRKANRTGATVTPVKTPVAMSPALPAPTTPTAPRTPSTPRAVVDRPFASPFPTSEIVPEETQMFNQRSEERKRALDVRSMDEVYQRKDEIGQGTYGKVYKALEKDTGEMVALKKFRMENEKEGFPITAIREIKLLKTLSHPNVVSLKEIVTTPATDYNRNMGDIYLAFEYLDHDLTGLLDTPNVQFTLPQIKCYMRQLLSGLAHLHSQNVLHRDIKGSNMLVGNNGMLKLADLGLARKFGKDVAHFTNNVITLWYRPPELLLGTKEYGPAVDMWSVGCLFAELLMRRPLFPGKDEMDQLDHIFRVCGTPSREAWPDHTNLPDWQKKQPTRQLRRIIRERFQNCAMATPMALDLVDKLLTLNPADRMSASEALGHEFFLSEKPEPLEPSQIPPYSVSAHEYEAKNRRKLQSKLAAMPSKPRSRQPNFGKLGGGLKKMTVPKPGAAPPTSRPTPFQPPLPQLPPLPQQAPEPPCPPPEPARPRPDQSNGASGYEVSAGNDAKRAKVAHSW